MKLFEFLIQQIQKGERNSFRMNKFAVKIYWDWEKRKKKKKKKTRKKTVTSIEISGAENIDEMFRTSCLTSFVLIESTVRIYIYIYIYIMLAVDSRTSKTISCNQKIPVWFGLLGGVLWHISLCRLFNTKSIFIQIVLFQTIQFSMSTQFVKNISISTDSVYSNKFS